MKPLKRLSTTTKRLSIAIVFVAVLVMPGALASSIWIENASSVFFFGAIPIAGAVFGGNQPIALRFTFLTAGVGALAFLVVGNTLLSTLLLATIAGLVGLTARRGHQSPGILMAITLAFMVVSPPVLTWNASGKQLEGSLFVLVGAGLLLAGGLWAVAIGYVVRNRIPAGAKPAEMELPVVIPYALALFVATGIATFGALTYDISGLGAWIILTVLLVVQPDQKSMNDKAKNRILGTLAGAVIAVIVLLILQSLGDQDGTVQLICAFTLIGIAMSYFQKGPYWKFVMFLTPGVILMDSNQVSNQILVAEVRVGFTLIGAVIAVLVAVGVRTIASKVNYSGS